MEEGRQQREVHGLYQRRSDQRVSTTDPDATPMRLKSGGLHLGYHTHYVVDGGKRRIILTVLVTPLPIAFWLGIGSTVIATGKASLDPKDLLGFLAGFLLGALLWSFFLASLLAWGRRFVTPRFFRLVNLMCGLALGFFALKLLWSTLLLLKG